MTDEEKRIFLSPLATRTESEIKKLVRGFVARLNMLYQVIPLIIDEEDDEHLDYLSSVYIECSPILTTLICYLSENNLNGKSIKIDNYVSNCRKIMGLLKVFYERNVYKKTGCVVHSEIKYSKLSYKIILQDIMNYFETM